MKYFYLISWCLYKTIQDYFHTLTKLFLSIWKYSNISFSGWFLDNKSSSSGSDGGEESEGWEILSTKVWGFCSDANLHLQHRPGDQGWGVVCLSLRENCEGNNSLEMVREKGNCTLQNKLLNPGQSSLTMKINTFQVDGTTPLYNDTVLYRNEYSYYQNISNTYR